MSSTTNASRSKKSAATPRSADKPALDAAAPQRKTSELRQRMQQDLQLAGLSERLTERIESGAPFGPGFGDCPADDATDDAEETETSSI